MTHLEEVIQYCKDIQSGRIKSCRLTFLACKRTLDDFKKSKKDPKYPYYFDEEAGNKIIDFAQGTKQYEGEWKGKNLILEPWQKHILISVYGWKKKDTKTRRYRKAYIQVGRKAGKSTLISTLLLYDLLLTPGAQVYAACTKKDTAKIIYNHCKQSILQNEALKKRLKIYNSTSRIVNETKAGFLECLPAEPDKMDGLNPSTCCIDEVASMKNYNIVKRLQSGMGTRPEGLIFEISSASDDMTSVGAQELKQIEAILEGVDRTDEAESFFGIVYQIDKDDDWRDESNYIKANPSLGKTVSVEFLHNQRLEAERNPSLEGEFRTRNLGCFISPVTAWIQPKIWAKVIENAKAHKLDLSKPFFSLGAVDLSKRIDLTAFTVCIYQDGYYYLKHKFYFPEESMKEKITHDNELWRHWVDQGYLTATPGRVINYQILFNDILEARDKYHLNSVLFDPYNSTSLINDLESEVELVEINQSMKFLSPFIKSSEELIYQSKIVDDNPVSAWQFNNAEVYRDPNDNLKIVKQNNDRNSTKRVDGVVTSCMCIGRIKQLLDAGEIDTRTPEEIYAETQAFLKNLNIYGN